MAASDARCQTRNTKRFIVYEIMGLSLVDKTDIFSDGNKGSGMAVAMAG